MYGRHIRIPGLRAHTRGPWTRFQRARSVLLGQSLLCPPGTPPFSECLGLLALNPDRSIKRKFERTGEGGGGGGKSGCSGQGRRLKLELSAVLGALHRCTCVEAEPSLLAAAVAKRPHDLSQHSSMSPKHRLRQPKFSNGTSCHAVFELSGSRLKELRNHNMPNTQSLQALA